MKADPPALPPTAAEFQSLRDVAKGPAQIDIPIEHEQRLTGMGYIEFGLGWLRLTDAGKARLAKGG